MTLSGLLVFAPALSIAAGSPGPGLAALVARVLTNGLRDVLPFLVAMWLGEALWLTFAVAGLAVIAKMFGALFIALKFAGAAYLLFLAWKMWCEPTDLSRNELATGRRPLRMFAAGLVVTLGWSISAGRCSRRRRAAFSRAAARSGSRTAPARR
jgi:threonine/homoserine/homoserine lactone efflux protein